MYTQGVTGVPYPGVYTQDVTGVPYPGVYTQGVYPGWYMGAVGRYTQGGIWEQERGIPGYMPPYVLPGTPTRVYTTLYTPGYTTLH